MGYEKEMGRFMGKLEETGIDTSKIKVEETDKFYVLKEFDKGSFLYLCSVELYKDVIEEYDYNSNFENNKSKAILFKDERRADAIADFVGGFSVKQSEDIEWMIG